MGHWSATLRPPQPDCINPNRPQFPSDPKHVQAFRLQLCSMIFHGPNSHPGQCVFVSVLLDSSAGYSQHQNFVRALLAHNAAAQFA